MADAALSVEPSSDSLLELSHISLSFKGIKAVSDISFAVQSGEI
jgi:branched-chain amino acid transport system ATP-binding protein